MHMHRPNLVSDPLYNVVVGLATGVAIGTVGILLAKAG